MKTFINKIFFDKTNNTLIQLFRYAFVGGIAFLADFGVLVFFKEVAGLHYLTSTTIGFIAGLIINYIISVLWVFSESKFNNKKLEFLVFAVIGIIGLGLTNIFMWLFTGKLGIHYLVSKIITTLLVFLWNFFGRKYLLFYTNKKH